MAITRKVQVDKKDFLRIDGIPMCKVTRHGLLELKDKDGRRARARGSAYVEVGFDQIQAAVQRHFLESSHEPNEASTNQRRHTR